MEVQIFGIRKDADTRKALRFFAERRIKTHFVDLTIRAASPGELMRFVQKFGVQALVDQAGKRYADLGLHHSRYSDTQWLQRLGDDPALLKVPLVRSGNRLSIGMQEHEWKQWLETAATK